MAKLDSITRDWINNAIEAQVQPAQSRGYLGISQLGNDCDRYKYNVLHNTKSNDVFTPRTLRIFERGHWEEARVIRDLESIGIAVTDTQLEIIVLGGIIKGHIDGIAHVKGEPHLLEIKTMADAFWKQYYKQGIEKSNPAYFLQAQYYANELKLAKILFCAVNKNDEMRKFELLDTRPMSCMDKAIDIVAMTEAPEKIGGPDYFKCKMCSFRSACHGY
jgi:hypothetical protein